MDWSKFAKSYQPSQSTSTPSPSNPTSTPSSSPSQPTRRLTAYISGPTELSPSLFSTHFIPRLQHALSLSHSFILSDAPGTDTLALQFLLSQSPSLATRITVYVSPNRIHAIPELLSQGVMVVEPDDPVFKVERTVWEMANYGDDDARYKRAQRDAVMTERSDYDVLWYRGVEESKAFYGKRYRQILTATELNERRREDIGRQRELMREQKGIVY